MSGKVVRNLVILAVVFGLGVGAGVLGILYATGGNAAPSRDTGEVVTRLSLDDPTPAPAVDVGAELAVINSKLDALLALAETGALAVPAPEESGTAEAAPSGERALYRITEDESEARFMIDEILLGNPTTVVGTTRRVAGDIIVNFDDPAASQLGEIAVNARTLRTDNEFRDQSIRGQILESAQDAFEFIIFEPVAVQNMTLTGNAVGDSAEFQVVGNLILHGVTQEVVFDVQATLAAPDRLEGLATAQIEYRDYNITINPPPNVGGIGDVVTLELDFVALAVEE